MPSTLRRKFEEARDRAEKLRKIDERTPEQDQELTDLVDRASSLSEELTAEEARDARLDALAEVSRAVSIPGTPAAPAEPETLTAGEYMLLARDVLTGNISTEEYRDRAAAYVDRASTITTDVAGILPEPIVGPLLDFYDDQRPVFSSFTSRPMPSSGAQFTRPIVTQHVAVAEQIDELDPLATQKFTVGSATVAKRVFGGVLEVSRQAQTWTDPSLMQAVLEDFVSVYANVTEGEAIDFLVAAATATSDWDATDTASISASFVDGVIALHEQTKRNVPVNVYMDLTSAAALAAPTGSTDRTVMSVVREALDSIGKSVNVIASSRFPADTRIMAAPSAIEAYELRYGLLSAVKPSVLATEIAYAGELAFYAPAAAAVSIEAAA